MGYPASMEQYFEERFGNSYSIPASSALDVKNTIPVIQIAVERKHSDNTNPWVKSMSTSTSSTILQDHSKLRYQDGD